MLVCSCSIRTVKVIEMVYHLSHKGLISEVLDEDILLYP